MIFIIPIVLGAVALGSAALGVGAGVASFDDIEKAKKIGKDAQKRHEQTQKRLKQEWEKTEKLAAEYGQLQLNVKIRTIGRFIAFIERIGQKGSLEDKQFLEGLKGFSVQDINAYKAEALEAQEISKGIASALGTGAAAGVGAVGVAQAVGTVAVPQLFGLFTTQVAVSQLGMSGVAAWLGGGSIALGGTLLGGIVAGPALAVGGFILAGKAEKALTQAREYESKANADIAKMEAAQDLLKQLQKRVIELNNLVENLNNRAVLSLNELESKPFVRDRDAGKFQQVGLLVKAMSEIMKTPILDNQGNLNPSTKNLQAKYSQL